MEVEWRAHYPRLSPTNCDAAGRARLPFFPAPSTGHDSYLQRTVSLRVLGWVSGRESEVVGTPLKEIWTGLSACDRDRFMGT